MLASEHRSGGRFFGGGRLSFGDWPGERARSGSPAAAGPFRRSCVENTGIVLEYTLDLVATAKEVTMVVSRELVRMGKSANIYPMSAVRSDATSSWAHVESEEFEQIG